MKEIYLAQAKHDVSHLPEKGQLSWESPSNIALVKYWGKHGEQLPDNASLSITLKESVSIVDINFRKQEGGGLQFTFEGKPKPEFETRVQKYLDKMKSYFPFLNYLFLELDSRNTFPHSAGIASSASFMSALALSLCTLESYGREMDAGFFKKASFMARLGSGSASRSVFGALAAWGYHPSVSESSDDYACSLSELLPERLKKIHDAVILVNSAAKKVSSSQGHKLMEGHFLAENRIQQATANMAQLLDAIKDEDWKLFAQVVENEALSLHAMMLSSIPGFTLLQQQTLDIIEMIREEREASGLKMAFTLDAGPNIHLLYHDDDRQAVEAFINDKLKPLAEEQRVIFDQMGPGPVLKHLKSYE